MKIILLIFGLVYVASACVYKCPGLSMKFSNPSYKPKPNGCGTKGMTIIKNFNPQFTPCCNNHDRCYGTCGNSKEYCDNSFKNCMRNTCAIYNVACRAAADSYYLAVHLFGCSAYTNVQKKACTCKYYA